MLVNINVTGGLNIESGQIDPKATQGLRWFPSFCFEFQEQHEYNDLNFESWEALQPQNEWVTVSTEDVKHLFGFDWRKMRVRTQDLLTDCHMSTSTVQDEMDTNRLTWCCAESNSLNFCEIHIIAKS